MGGVSAAAAGMRGNLADLAATGIASEPTLRKWIAAQPDRPWIIKRGSNGDAYEIDLAAAVEAFRAEQDAATQAARERAEKIQQLALELGIGGDGGEQSAVGLSIAERRQLLEEEIVAIKLAKLRGELVPRASVEAAFGDVLIKFGQQLATFTARLAKKVDLERHQIVAIDRLMASDRQQLADMMERMELGDDIASGDDGIGAPSAVEVAAVPHGG
jgi:hypothetical protein